jgi:hypothetical protein
MKNTSLVTIGLMLLVLFSLPLMSATWAGGQYSVTNVTGNLTPLYFTFDTVQNTTNPGIGANVTYITKINISTGIAGATMFNLTNFTINMPDNNTYPSNTTIILTNSTGGTETSHVYTIGQAAGQYGYVSFYGISGFANVTSADLNGTKNQTVWNLTWISSAPVASTKIASSLSGRAYTETWNITSANSNMTVSNSSLVVSPSYFYTRIGAPTAVTFNATSLTTSGYSANYSDIESWTDLNVNLTDANMLRYGSGYGTLSITYNGPVISSSSGNSPSAAVSVVPTTAREVSLWLLIGLGCVVVIVGIVILTFALRKR